MQALSNLERADEDFLCPVCLNLLVDPVVGACGHDICLHCYRRWVVEERRRTCPVCREPVSATVPGVCMRLRDLIRRLYPQQELERRQEVEAQEQQQQADKERQRQQRLEAAALEEQEQQPTEERLQQQQRELAGLEQQLEALEARLQQLRRRQRRLSENGEPAWLPASLAAPGSENGGGGSGPGAAAARSILQSPGDALMSLLRWVGRHGHHGGEQPTAPPAPAPGPSSSALHGTPQPQQPSPLPVWELGPPLESLTFSPGWAEVAPPRRQGPRAKPRLLESKRRQSGRRA